ncbi:MAG: tyrosine--tRNA ligase, partial [Agathobacter sp.]|nr:tyrosine--tRNA ligase [Agathobacter sp.]
HALFAGGGSLEHMPTVEVAEEDLFNGALDIMGALVKAGLAESRSDARRAVQQGGVTVADVKVTDIATSYTLESFVGEGLIIKRGKKKFAKLIAK